MRRGGRCIVEGDGYHRGDGVIAQTDAEVAAFVATSAAILGLQLDDEALAEVRDAMRVVINQVAPVLAYSREPARK